MKKMILVAAALLGTSALSNAQHVHFSFVVNSGPSTVVVTSDPVPAPVPVVASPMLVTAPYYEASFVDLVTAMALNMAQAMLFEPIYRSYCHDVYYAPNPMAVRSVYYNRFLPYLTPRQIEMVWGHPVAYHHYGHANPVFHFEPGWYYNHHGYQSHYGHAPHHAPTHHNHAPAHHNTAPVHHPNQGYRSGNGYHQGNVGNNNNPGNHNSGNNGKNPGYKNPGNNSHNNPGNVNRPDNKSGHNNAGNRAQTRFTSSTRSAGGVATRTTESNSSRSSRGTFGGRTSDRQKTANTRSR